MVCFLINPPLMIMPTAYLNNYYAYNTPTEDLVGT
jgi:hypothetical protein